jgi:hypothetical protein
MNVAAQVAQLCEPFRSVAAPIYARWSSQVEEGGAEAGRLARVPWRSVPCRVPPVVHPSPRRSS